MPLYEYECDACGHRFEIIQKFSDGPPDVCPKCGKGPLQRQQSSPAFQFKGTGWYVTDYAAKGKAGGDKDSGDRGGGDKGDKGGESKPAEAKKSESGGSSGESGGTDSKKSEAPAAAPAVSKKD